MTRGEQIKKAWESAFKNIVESIDTERTREEVACIFFELGCRWADENKPVDWQQVRIQAAIAAMQGIVTSKTMVEIVNEVVKTGKLQGIEVSADTAVSRMSIGFADALVKELKGE